MAYDIQFNLPSSWSVEQDIYVDESGFEISHLEAHLRNDKEQTDNGYIEIYVGDMPEGETAEDQAFANYAETVGFFEDDPEDYNPIEKVRFNGRNAWGFDAYGEDETPLKFLAQEVRKGVLAIMLFSAPTDAAVKDVCALAERNFRVK